MMSNDEKQVKKNFWKKAKQTAGKVPFVLDAVALYFCALDPKTPTGAKIAIFGALAYFISPLDAVPDLLPGGFLDDAAAIATVIMTAKAYITEDHRRQALAWLRDADADEELQTA
ncbi:YkvA family protein [Paenibacillus sp.]|uniref:YkvA family protein n=1 Tax=Paenibacillus sp. TaxID=58172 RepID=UPI002D232A4E|nr:YkvA family protein [Paenibacillus sp.]HZG85610.1 YkvA family protein [Paenibacillus sp.]